MGFPPPQVGGGGGGGGALYGFPPSQVRQGTMGFPPNRHHMGIPPLCRTVACSNIVPSA